MGKIRIYDLAKRHNKTNAEVKELLERGGMEVSSASVSVDEAQAEAILTNPAGRRPRRIAVRRRRRAEPEPAPEAQTESSSADEDPTPVTADQSAESSDEGDSHDEALVVEAKDEQSIEPIVAAHEAPAVVEAGAVDPVSFERRRGSKLRHRGSDWRRCS